MKKKYRVTYKIGEETKVEFVEAEAPRMALTPIVKKYIFPIQIVECVEVNSKK